MNSIEDIYIRYKITKDKGILYNLLHYFDTKNEGKLFIKYGLKFFKSQSFKITNDNELLIVMKLAQYYESDFNYSPSIAFYNMANYYKPHYIAYNNLGNITKSTINQYDAIHYYYKSVETIRNEYPNIDKLFTSPEREVYITILSNFFMNFQYLKENDTYEYMNKYKYILDELSEYYTVKYNENYQRKIEYCGGKRKIGILSSDFRAHPVGYMIETILKYIDKDKYEIYCFDNSVKDIYSSFLRQYQGVNWIEIGQMRDEHVIEIIKNLNIELLVEMMGYTSGTRLGILLAKPAPKIVSYFAYPGTLQLNAIGYKLIGKNMVDEYFKRTYYSEKLIEIPTGLQCYKPPPTLDTPNKILRIDNSFNIACFNNPQKFNDEMISTWATILHRIPTAKLYLRYFLYKSVELVDLIKRKFKQYNIDESRLDFGYNLLIESLEEYKKMDIALDPFPYNGGTITSEALYMNTPIITIEGNLYHSRVGVELLKTLGLDELIVKNKDEYIEKVVEIYRNPSKLKWYHKNINRLMIEKGLVDSSVYVRGFEVAINNILSY